MDGRRARRDRGRLAVIEAVLDLLEEGENPPLASHVAKRPASPQPRCSATSTPSTSSSTRRRALLRAQRPVVRGPADRRRCLQRPRRPLRGGPRDPRRGDRPVAGLGGRPGVRPAAVRRDPPRGPAGDGRPDPHALRPRAAGPHPRRPGRRGRARRHHHVVRVVGPDAPGLRPLPGAESAGRGAGPSRRPAPRRCTSGPRPPPTSPGWRRPPGGAGRPVPGAQSTAVPRHRRRGARGRAGRRARRVRDVGGRRRLVRGAGHRLHRAALGCRLGADGRGSRTRRPLVAAAASGSSRPTRTRARSASTNSSGTSWRSGSSAASTSAAACTSRRSLRTSTTSSATSGTSDPPRMGRPADGSPQGIGGSVRVRVARDPGTATCECRGALLCLDIRWMQGASPRPASRIRPIARRCPRWPSSSRWCAEPDPV